MKNHFQSKAVPRGTRTIWRYLSALFLLFTFAIGNVWADEIFGFTVTSSTTAKGSYSATGGTAECTGSAMSTGGSNEITVGTQTFYKFSSSSQWTFTLSSGKFAAGDVISFTGACTTSNKTGKGFAIQTSPVIAVTGNFPASQSNVVSYTVVADDGIAGQSSFSIKRNDSDIKFGTVSVTRSSGGGEDPVCPSGLSITSKNDKTAFLEGDAIELTAALTAGNGTITYQWYKGGTAEGNKLTGKTAAKLEIASCVEGDAGDYYCVASKSDCSDAVNADAFTITVAHNPCATHHWFVATADATTNGVTNWNGFTNTVTGSNNQNNSVTIDGTTYTLTKRTGSTGGGGTILGFTIPANKAGTLYGYMKSSGSAARILSLKKGDDVVKTNTEIVDGAWTLISIDAIAPGTYTLSPDQNVQVQMFVLKICDATFHTITLDLAGGTGETSISALDGAPATKPTDPTWEHHRFDGWYNGATPYDWTANVTGDITLTAHWTQLYTISFNNGGGSGDAPAAIADKAQSETFEVPANTFTAPDGKEFDKWNDGSADYAPGATYTVGTANVVLTAQWKAVTAKYTVIFKDGETTLDTKLFEVGSNPSDADIDKTKPLFAFAAWQKDAADIALDDEFWATVVKDASVTLTARWTKAYAQDADLEGLVESEGSGADWQAYLSGKGYGFSTSNVTLDAKNVEKAHANWPYQGLKAKEVGAYVEGRIAADKLVIIKLGHMAAAANVTLDGVAAGTATGLDADEPAGQLNYFYAENEAVLRYETTNAGACVLKAITITDPFQVTFDANGGDDVTSLNGTPSVTLPSATKGTESFLGWFDGETKVGEAGESYTPTANITLKAHWEAVSTDARINALTYAIGAGSPVDIYEADKNTFNIALPYAQSYDAITVAATPNHASASIKSGASLVVSSLPGAATFTIVAQSGAEENYTVNFSMAPKDGVSIIKVATTGGTNKTVTGLYAGDGDVNLSSSKKMDNGKYIGFTLDGTTLQAGDQINVHTTTAANTEGSHIIFYDNMTDKNELYETGEIGGTGDNIFEINAAMIGATTAYVYRSNADAAHQWNGYVDFIEVTRAMNPVLTAITIDGRDGEIDALDDKHFSVTIPYEADLAALTVVPTIVRNAAHPTTPEAVISNEGAWILGDNTYRIMDKDGDYTDYTITLDRDVLKHTVSFNTHGGTAIDPVLVAHGEYLAAAPADPTKEDYIFQYWSEDEDGAEVDVATVQINADKEFHAVWVADGAIKLLDGSTVNHTNFITAVTADETVEFQGNTVNYAKFSGTCSGVNSVKDLTRVIAYNATTNKTKIRISAHNNSTSARNILVKGLVEGASAAVDLATIALANKEDKVSDWIEFDNAANRTIYIMVSSSAGDVYFTQVKVVESGETPMKQAGEAGYSLNLNKGRFFGLASTDLAFEGLNARLSGDYTALNSGYAKLNATSMSFTVASDMNLVVTTNNSKTYYVTKGAAGTDNETAKTGVSEFDLTAGTWYITAGSSEVQFTNIAFAAPKCEQPTITPMSNSDLCEGDDFAPLTVSATVSDEGTLHYAWFKEAGETDEAVGTDAASYTPEADGEYYVIVTNRKDGFSDNSATSNTITVTHFAAAVITTAPLNKRGEVDDVVTLTVAATGKNVSYKWYTCDEDGSNEVALDPAETGTSLNVTVTAGMNQWYKVIVTSDCGNAEAKAKVSEFEPTTPASVTTSILWDWTSSVWPASGTAAFTNEDAPDYELLADADAIVPNAEGFRSDMLYGKGQYVWRSGNKFFQGTAIKFTSTVAGMVRVYFRSTGSGKTVEVAINGTSAGSRTNSFGWSSYVEVPAGEVEMICTGDGYTRIQKIEFLEIIDSRAEYAAKDLGTACYEYDALVIGATPYIVAGVNGNGYIVFDEITSGVIDAGYPYLFEAAGGKVFFCKPVGTTAAPLVSGDEITVKGMIGTFSGTTLTQGEDDICYFAGRHIWRVNDFTVGIDVDPHRCYVNYDVLRAVPAAPAAAPGRRRVIMGVNGKDEAQGFENLDASETPMKIMIDGTLYILRGEKVFDATGRLVK